MSLTLLFRRGAACLPAILLAPGIALAQGPSTAVTRSSNWPCRSAPARSPESMSSQPSRCRGNGPALFWLRRISRTSGVRWSSACCSRASTSIRAGLSMDAKYRLQATLCKRYFAYMPEEQPHPWIDSDRDVVHADAAIMQSLSHPLRMRLLGLLRVEGPSTATKLASQVGESSGLTSYHLRQLASVGLVTDAEPGDLADVQQTGGRERWWKAAAFRANRLRRRSLRRRCSTPM